MSRRAIGSGRFRARASSPDAAEGAAAAVQRSSGAGWVTGGTFNYCRGTRGGKGSRASWCRYRDSSSVLVGVVDDDMAEPRDCVHQPLEGVVPLRGGLEEIHYAAMGEAELKVAG